LLGVQPLRQLAHAIVPAFVLDVDPLNPLQQLRNETATSASGSSQQHQKACGTKRTGTKCEPPQEQRAGRDAANGKEGEGQCTSFSPPVSTEKASSHTTGKIGLRRAQSSTHPGQQRVQWG
jgi:hypothetical protein